MARIEEIPGAGLKIISDDGKRHAWIHHVNDPRPSVVYRHAYPLGPWHTRLFDGLLSCQAFAVAHVETTTTVVGESDGRNDA